MKKSLYLCLFMGVLATGSALAQDSDEVVYSTEGYCLLANEGVSNDYLRAYAKKLGTKPSDKVCSSFKDIVASARPKDWDYPGGKPYPGSVIKLSASQIELLKSLKKAEQ